MKSHHPDQETLFSAAKVAAVAAPKRDAQAAYIRERASTGQWCPECHAPIVEGQATQPDLFGPVLVHGECLAASQAKRPTAQACPVAP